MQLPATARMLLRPRSTMRWILDEDPNYGVMSIAILAGVTAMLRTSMVHGMHPLPGGMGLHPDVDAVVSYGIGATPAWPMTIITILLIGSLFGVVAIYLGGAVLWLLGAALGGIGRYQDVRSALAWAFVPYTWLLPLWGLAAWLYGSELRQVGFSYTAVLPRVESEALYALVIGDYVLRILCLFWLVMKLSVAHRFAIWKALLATAVLGIVLVYAAPRYAPFGF